jgi:N-acetylmuramic acid 6-phosphate etherase
MIRLGRVHEGLMVDMQAINAKLTRRSESILRRLTGRTREEVTDALQRANGSVKLAVLLLNGCGVDEAAHVLERAGGRLRTALEQIGRAEAGLQMSADAPRIAQGAPSGDARDAKVIRR